MSDICDDAEILEAAERERGIQAARVALLGPPAFDCDDCGEAIPPARKAAFPAARRCVGCQDSAEREAIRSRRAGPVVLGEFA